MELKEIYVIMSCDRHAGDQIKGDFFVDLEDAKKEIDRKFEMYSQDNPLHISRLDHSYAGFRLLTRWGQWQEFSIRRIDRAGRLAQDLADEVAQGLKVKAGIL
jgi:hypothetical protein